MLVELGLDMATGAGPTVMVGLAIQDVERLRAGEQLSIALRDVGLMFADEGDGHEPRILVIALGGQAEPKQRGRLLLTESMIAWMRDTTPLVEKLADLGFPAGKLVLFHGKTDEDTTAAVRRHKERLARTVIPDTSVVTAYTLDKTSGRVSVQRFEQRPHGADARANWAPIVFGAVGAIAAFAGALRQHDAMGRGLCIAIGVLLAGVAGWSLRKVLRRGGSSSPRGPR